MQGHHPSASGAAAPGGGAPAGDALAHMHAALGQALAVAVAPSFLRGEVDAGHMANTMVAAARQGLQAGASLEPPAQARALGAALHELQVCGSGYLAGRCDGACVARTMTAMLREFGR